MLDVVNAREVWLLREYASLLIDTPDLSAEAEHLAASHLFDLAGLLEPSTSLVDAGRSPGVHAARLRAIQNDALANLARPPSAE